MSDQNYVPSSRARRGQSAPVLAVCAFLLLVTSACGGATNVEEVVADESGQQTSDATPPQAEPEAGSDTTARETSAEVSEPEAETETVDEQPAAPAGVTQGTFELVLESGVTFSAPVSCVLNAEISAGEEILFYAAGNHQGQSYDVTQWGETSFGGSQSVEIVDGSSYDTLWRSVASTGLVLELNGNVITGKGGFYQGDDLNGERTKGELTVSC